MRGLRAHLLIVVALWACSLARAAVATDTAVVDQMRSLWKIRKAEIVTVDLQYRVHRQAVPRQGTLSAGQLEELIDQFGLRASPARSIEFLTAIAGNNYQPNLSDRRLWIDGDKSRYEYGKTIKIHDSDYLLNKNQQLNTIHVEWKGLGTAPIPPINWLRSIPRVEGTGLVPGVVTESTTELISDSWLVLKGRKVPCRIEFLCDTASGVPIRRRNIIDGELTETQYQLALTYSTDGVVFPSCLVSVRSVGKPTDATVTSVDVTELLDATFNRPIPAETFVMPKPKGIEVLDRRDSPSSRPVGVTSLEVGDVRSLIGPSAVVGPPSPAPSWPRRAFFLINGFLFIALGIWLWRRVSLEEPKH